MILRIDRNIYSDYCISSVVYWFSDRFCISRTIEDNEEVISFNGINDENTIKEEFYQKLNDFKLRDLINKETKDIRTILYAKAFGDFDDITEEDILNETV